MIELPRTPLQSVPRVPENHEAPALFLKREDLLPFGGGGKVRRLLSWLEELAEREGEHGRRLPNKTVAVLSDRGAHTFRVLTKMLEEAVLPIESLVFWERATPKTPYSEAIRRMYFGHPHVVVHSGSSLAMLLRFLWTRCFGARDTAVIGVGGSVSTKRQPYRRAFEECLAQLAASRKDAAREIRTDEGRVWHLFAVASGNMADCFLRTIRDQHLPHHRVLGVLTGPGLLARFFVRLRYLGKRSIVLVRGPRLSWSEYETVAARFFETTGVWIDPNHTSSVASLLDHLPAFVQREDVVVFWITCPFIHTTFTKKLPSWSTSSKSTLGT